MTPAHPSDEDFALSEAAVPLRVTVIALGSNWTFDARPDDTVASLAQQVAGRLRVPATKVVRLIYRGRLLEGPDTLASYGMRGQATVHGSVSDPPRPPAAAQLRRAPSREELRGFDRLRDYGFAPDEIQAARTQFHQHRMMSNGYLTTTSDARELQELEEQWINQEVAVATPSSAVSVDVPRDAAAASSSHPSLAHHAAAAAVEVHDEQQAAVGNFEDLFKGMMMGFALGFLMLLWIPDRSLPIRTKYGIVAGLGISFTFGFIRLLT
eukprot:TRINITY_DN55_c0_g2_i3.p2 TRINITY_DN55_c0_g2~~TRINITY_DN55_c0_g2_i3.p2  ORF type:complete len:299 (+),score=85.46 TRINITY_DN55_c0_g2_i3:97-897(+)